MVIHEIIIFIYEILYQPECESITIQNGNISPQQPVTHGTRITISCDYGYEINGEQYLTCVETSYNGTAPECQLKGTSTHK